MERRTMKLSLSVFILVLFVAGPTAIELQLDITDGVAIVVTQIVCCFTGGALVAFLWEAPR